MLELLPVGIDAGAWGAGYDEGSTVVLFMVTLGW
jgi:hypothetical protein